MEEQIEQIISNADENSASAILAFIRKGKKIVISTNTNSEFAKLFSFVKNEATKDEILNIGSFFSAKFEGFDVDKSEYSSFAEYCR